PQVVFAAAAARHPPFTGEPYDLQAALPGFPWPVAVVSGERDLRTPRPVAEQVAGLAPDAVLVPLPGLGHSALDSHPLAALHVARRRLRRAPAAAGSRPAHRAVAPPGAAPPPGAGHRGVPRGGAVGAAPVGAGWRAESGE